MINVKSSLPLVLFLLLPLASFAQTTTLLWENDISVIDENGVELPNPWAGGLNSAQFNTIDLNQDGAKDLLVFDRTSYALLPFLAVENAYQFAPEYANNFPKIEAWIVLADYNCDGKNDIFTHNNFGVTVYTNTTTENGALSFSEFGIPETKGISGFQIPLKVDITDVPAITDVDSDGDLDLLTFLTPSIGGTVEYNRNYSMERFGHCDSLIFEKETARWGGFEEAGTCRTYNFDGNARIEHAGSSILALDLDADQDKDLIIGEIGCTNLVQMTNMGTLEEATFENATLDYPVEQPVDFHIFPAAYYQDVNFDGKRDLLVSPNLEFNEGFTTNFSQSSLFYQNKGEDNAPEFEFAQNDFLQEQMIDVGEGALPTLADADGDGDPDLWLGNTGSLQEDNSFYATVAYYENIGGLETPVFELRDKDYLSLSQLSVIELRPQWVDMNSDGRLDFTFNYRDANGTTQLGYILEDGGLDINRLQTISLNRLRALDKPLFFDFDLDGDQDVLVGKLGGALAYYENDGAMNFNLVNEALGGIDDNFFAQRLCPTITDWDADGNTDLLTIDRSGTLNVFSNIQRQDALDWTANEIKFSNDLNGQAEPYFLGRGGCPTAFQQYVAVGTIGGGVHFFSQTERVLSSLRNDEIIENQIQVFPNPTKSQVTVETEKVILLTWYNAVGEEIFPRLIQENHLEKTYDLNEFPNGLYFIKGINRNSISVQKIILRK